MEKAPKDRIVVAEDDPVSRRVLEAFLVKWNYDVISVADGLEALQILERHDAPRLAVLDWMMPGMEGIQICQRVREQNNRPYTYILLLTARSQKEDLLIGLQSGADDYLTKPVDTQELRARLHVGQRILDLQDRLIRAKEELLFQATHDPLTGIANRGVILEAVRRELAHQMRERGSFAIVLVDLDHFKYVNDKYGHQCGDAVLKEAARRMKNSVRPYDIVGRYGGEEFLIVVPSSEAPGACGLAERIRKAIANQPITTQAGDVSITASFGVAASAQPRPVDSQSLLRLADEALYRAKERGRNRVELATPPEPAGALPTATGETLLQSRSR